MPDNPISTPLPADLPVNWQTGQIVAPNGADVGLSAQHGYNYLMQQLNAAQQAVNTLGQAIAALTGEDIPTSGTDSTTIAAALSKKADATPPQEYDLPLAEGLTGTAKYSKDQFGLVSIVVSASAQSGTVTSGQVVGTLPAGFRPSQFEAALIIGNANPNSPSNRHPVVLQAESDGTLSIAFTGETVADQLAGVLGRMYFPAAAS